MTVKALDHDFRPDQKVTPFGIYLPHTGELYLYLTTSRVTSDFIVDCLTDFWQTVKAQFPQVTSLLINADNGPENHSRRTQFMFRLTQLADDQQLHLRLAYYPPYHSKYNPIERVWGGLEQHWNGTLLDQVDTVVAFAKSFIWRQLQPVVSQVRKVYHTGQTLSKPAMQLLERTRFHRLPGLDKWFVSIFPTTP